MKSQRECHEALCAGKTLIDKYGRRVKYNQNGHMVTNQAYLPSWDFESWHFNNPNDWEIYSAPSATYDEAVNAKCVKIYWPNHNQPIPYRREYTQFGCDEKIWCVANLDAFDLAERRGYRMEVVE